MVYFFGNTPQGLLFEAISATSFKFDGTTLVATAQDAINLATFVASLREEIQTIGRFAMRDLLIQDSVAGVTLGLYARYNATMHIELLNTATQERISPLYCVCSDIDLVQLLETLLQ